MLKNLTGFVVLSLLFINTVFAVASTGGWVYDEDTGEKYWLEPDNSFMEIEITPEMADQSLSFGQDSKIFQWLNGIENKRVYKANPEVIDYPSGIFRQKADPYDNKIQQERYGSNMVFKKDSGDRKLIPQPDRNIEELYSDPGWSDCKRKCDGSHQLCNSAVTSPFEKWRCNIGRMKCRKSCHNSPHF